jgi:uncharacterized damage-inducible protein DinB
MSEKDDLIALSGHVFERTRSRLAGLTDAEYFWEPAPHCWSLRVRDDGTTTADWEPNPKSSPFTTIAWRLCHLIDCYGGVRNELWLRGTYDDAGRSRSAPQPNAAAARVALDVAHGWWSALLAALSETDLIEPLGPVAGPYAESNKGGFVLHMLDEVIHHAAEVALLRDLFVATHGLNPEP